MADNTTVEWARNSDGSKGKTWNFVIGCDRVSPGCDGCYAISTSNIRAAHPHPAVATAFAGLTARTDAGLDWTGQVNVLNDRLSMPFRWRKPTRIFVNSLADIFHKNVPSSLIIEAFAVMALTPRHTYIIPSKQHARMRSLLDREDFWVAVGRQARHSGRQHGMAASDYLGDGQDIHDAEAWNARRYLPNVWLGASVENQQFADIRIPALLATPAAVRFISAEPLLGPIDIGPYLPVERDAMCEEHWSWLCGRSQGECQQSKLAWVITGGESGPKARPMHPDWARTLRDQTRQAGVPFFFKQWGSHAPEENRTWTDRDGSPRGGITLLSPCGTCWNGIEALAPPTAVRMRRVGKNRAGHMLDGRTWHEFPADHFTAATT